MYHYVLVKLGKKLDQKFQLCASAEQLAAWRVAAGKQPLAGWIRDRLDLCADILAGQQAAREKLGCDQKGKP